jgi:hypothetical protein
VDNDIHESECIMIQKVGGEVGKPGVGLGGSKGPAGANAGAPSMEAGAEAENGKGKVGDGYEAEIESRECSKH